MKVAIIVFSPTGNTLKVAEMLAGALEKRAARVQLLDITRSKALSNGKTGARCLQEKIEEHDLLVVGSPVYAHHMHYGMLAVIRSLPKAGGRWGKPAIPYVTYGGISSGIALHEAAKALRKSGRIVVAGMKINAFHVMSRILPTQHNTGMPGREAQPLIDRMAAEIAEMSIDACRDITKELNYQSARGQIKAKLIFREKFWQNHFYPKLKVDDSLCTHCGKCVSSCPVQRLELGDDGLKLGRSGIACIHCTQCVHVCPAGALEFDCDKAKWDRLFRKAVSGKGPLPSNEKPKSAVYPTGSA